jgi:hypothetical protein
MKRCLLQRTLSHFWDDKNHYPYQNWDRIITDKTMRCRHRSQVV